MSNTASVLVNNIKNTYVVAGVTLPGAIGDGIANDTAAIAYWLSQGGLVWAPPGTYRVTASLAYTLSGTTFFGSGVAVTTITADDTGGNFGNVVTMANLRGCALVGFTIDAKAARTAGAAVAVSGGVSSFQLGAFGICNGGHSIDVDMNNQFDGIVFTDSGGLGDWGTMIGNAGRKAMWRNFAAGGHGGVWFNSLHAASQVVENIFMSAVLATGAAVGIRYTASGDVTLRSIQTLGMGGGFACDCTANPSASGDGLVQMMNCQWDSTSSHATYDNVLVNLGGGVGGVVFIDMGDSWVAGATGNGVHVTGNATPLLMNWANGQSFSNGAWGVLVDNGAGTGGVKLGATIQYSANTSGDTHFV